MPVRVWRWGTDTILIIVMFKQVTYWVLFFLKNYANFPPKMQRCLLTFDFCTYQLQAPGYPRQTIGDLTTSLYRGGGGGGDFDHEVGYGGGAH